MSCSLAQRSRRRRRGKCSRPETIERAASEWPATVRLTARFLLALAAKAAEARYMRALSLGFGWLGLALALVVACGRSQDDGPLDERAGSSGSAAGGVSGSASGGSASSGGATGGGGVTGGNASGGIAPGLVDCDPKQILCKRLAPSCAAGEVPSVAGSCYGDCVKIDQCACSAAAECPEPDQYTCWAKQHCGPFVQ
jgi:hypothetical protein